MAYFVSRGLKNSVYLYYYKDGKLVCLPRKLTKHLDHFSEDQKKGFLEDFLFRNNLKRTERTILTDEKTLLLVDSFCDYLRTQDKAESTISAHRQMLQEHCLPYFLDRKEPLTDPNSWVAYAPKLIDHFKAKKLTQDIMVRCNVAMRQFWRYLQEEMIVVATTPLVLRSVKIKIKETPLTVILTPEQALKIIDKTPDDYIKMIFLMGYFFSLRPQEIFSMKKSQFLAGSKATELQCCKVMLKNELYNKFAYKVDDQRTKQGKIADAKAGSKGWVACFNEQAAKMIIDLIKDKKGEDLFFAKHHNDYWFRKWSKLIAEEVTIKDLRRMSLYHLGHYSELGIIGLKNHARHSKVETTAKYIRRPETTPISDSDLDLDS